MTRLSSLCFILMAANEAFARPVSYVNGWAVMSENRAEQSQLMANYTVMRNLSLGVHSAAYRDGNQEWYMASPIVNGLVERRNDGGRQSNLYIGGGYGALWNSAGTYGAGAATVDADSETRTWYMAIHHEHVWAPQQRDFHYSRLRLGFNPYLVEVSNLHTWLVMQWDYQSWNRRSRVGTLLRFFFQNVLWEIGANTDGSLQFNWAVEL